MSHTQVDEELKVHVLRKPAGEAVYTIKELAAKIAAGDVGEMVPARLASETSFRVLKFHPIWADVADAVGKAPKNASKAASGSGTRMGFVLVSLVAVGVLAAVVVFLPKIKVQLPNLASLAPPASSAKQSPIEVARNHVIQGELDQAKAVFTQMKTKGVKPEVDLEIRIYQAIMALEAESAKSAFDHLRSLKRTSELETIDAEFAPILRRLADAPRVENIHPVIEFRNQHPDYYPAAHVELWAYSGTIAELNDTGKYRELLRNMSMEYPSQRSEDLYAQTCYTHREYGDAIKAFEGILTKRPDDTDVLVKLGQANLEINRKEEAMAYFKRAVELDPSLPLFLN